MPSIKIEDQIGGKVISLNGQFIGGNETDELRDNLKELAQTENMKVVIDMKDVTYLNSTALGVLISSHASFVKRNGKVILCNLGESIENIFVITKLTLVFHITETLEEAIKELSN